MFCFVGDPPNRDASDRVLGVFGKLLTRRGAWAWFHGVWTCDAKVLEYWMISSLKIKLNSSWNFQRNWNVPLVLLQRTWSARFNGIYLVIFGFRMWEILIFLKWFLLVKIQINSKKPGFGRKNELRTIWASGTGHTLLSFETQKRGTQSPALHWVWTREPLSRTEDPRVGYTSEPSPPGVHSQYFWLIRRKEDKMKRKNRMMESCQMNEISHHAW